jgi:hypothetical protein
MVSFTIKVFATNTERKDPFMRRSSLFILVVLTAILQPFSVCAQLKPVPKIEWQKCYGGSDGEGGDHILQTADGGYIIAGSSNSSDGQVTGNHGWDDIWILKITATGDIQWQKSIGGTSLEALRKIQQTNDGGYVIAGHTLSNDGDVSGNHGSVDYLVIKLSASGDIQWQKCYGGSRADRLTSLCTTSDGGYIVSGGSNSDDGDVAGNHGRNYTSWWIIKLNAIGDILWQKSYGDIFHNGELTMWTTSDGGYIAAGSTQSADVVGYHGGLDGLIIKLTANCDIQWQKCLGGSLNDFIGSTQETRDSGYIIPGISKSNDGDVTGNHGLSDCWIVKLTANGVIDWQRSFGGSSEDQAHSIREAPDGRFIVSGFTKSVDGDLSGYRGNTDSLDAWLIGLSSTGDIEWQQRFGGTSQEWFSQTLATQDSGFIAIGWTSSNNGDVSGNHGREDIWVVKFGAGNTCGDSIMSAFLRTGKVELSIFSIIPNPAATRAVLTVESQEASHSVIEIVSLTGAVVKRISANLGKGKQEIPLNGLESLMTGSYEVVVKSDGDAIAHTKLNIVR